MPNTQLESKKPDLQLDKIPRPDVDHCSKLELEIEVEGLTTFEVDGTTFIEARAFGKGFPAKALLGTTTFASEEGFNPNPRGLNPSKALVKQIKDTLIVEPSRFSIRSRTPIWLFACVREVKKTDRNTFVLVLSFGAGQGLSDGQHRLWAIRSLLDGGASLSEVRIPLTVEVNKIVEPVGAKDYLVVGDSDRHKKMTRFNTMGLFEPFKEAIPENWAVRYYDGQLDVPASKQCSVDHLMQLLAMLDRRYCWTNPRKTHPKEYALNASSNYEGLHSSSVALLPLLEDVVRIETEVFENAYEFLQSGEVVPTARLIDSESESYTGNLLYLPNGKHFPLKMPEYIVFPIVSAFRLWLHPEKPEWLMPFDKFGIKLTRRLWGHTIDLLNECGARNKTPAKLFVEELENWRQLCAIAHAQKKKFGLT